MRFRGAYASTTKHVSTLDYFPPVLARVHALFGVFGACALCMPLFGGNVPPPCLRRVHRPFVDGVAVPIAVSVVQEFTSAERRMMVLAEADPRSKEEVEEEENKAKAVIAAKTSNLSVSEPASRKRVVGKLLRNMYVCMCVSMYVCMDVRM